MMYPIRSSSHIHPYAIVSPIVSKPQLRFLNVSGCCAALTCLSCRGCHLPWLQENLREVEEMDVIGGWPTDKSNQGTYWIIGNIGIESEDVNGIWHYQCFCTSNHGRSLVFTSHLLILMYRRHIAPTLEFLSIRTIANIHYMGWLPGPYHSSSPSSCHLCNYNN
jgi:hypothetical protein